MIVLIAGASHTGKTALAQMVLEKNHIPYLSIDHLKMGLIRSGQTTLTPMSSDAALTEYLWPIVREMIKTAVENRQDLIVEGCYIPVNWQSDFDEVYLAQISCIRLVMSENYIRTHFALIKAKACVAEQRLDDTDCTVESLLRDNRTELEACRRYGAEYLYIDTEYNVAEQLEKRFPEGLR